MIAMTEVNKMRVKPCPFCGSDDVQLRIKPVPGNSFHWIYDKIICGDCGISCALNKEVEK